MPLHRRLTARTALVVLLVWLAIALIFHLKAELWDTAPAPASTTTEHGRPVAPGKALSGGGNEPELPGKDEKKTDGAPKAGGKRTAVVVASQQSENTTWLDEYFPQWEKNVYRVDDSSAPLHVPKNKGRESMVYLTYATI